MVQGRIHSIESFALVDGPGVRCAVFLQGCRMRCQYCHNPDTWTVDGGQLWSAENLFEKVYRYKPYWKDNGGITVSGGEALLQIDFVTEFFQIAKENGVHTALDTSGNPFQMKFEYLEKFDLLMSVTDLFILDLKEMDEKKHQKLTGQGNQNILQMASYLSDHGKEMWIRHVLVPGLTDEKMGLVALAEFCEGLKTVTRREILPYHTLGIHKWEKMGIFYSLQGVPEPTKEEIRNAEETLGIRIDEKE